jgi:uncharacterized membrane protein
MYKLWINIGWKIRDTWHMRKHLKAKNFTGSELKIER